MQVTGDTLDWAGASLTRLLDGTVSFGRDFFPDPRGASIPETVSLPVQAYLLQRDGHSPVLIDTGSGALYGDKGGGLKAALAALGVAASDIGSVLMTHMHGDHCGGLLDPGFPNATIYVPRAELAYWPTQDHPAAQYIAQNNARLCALEEGETPLPGVALWALPGHTPGHAGFVVDGRVAVLGDVMHRADIQLDDPLIATKFDVDRASATTTRQAALAEVAKRQWICCGGHFQVPGTKSPFLRLTAKGAGYMAHAA